MSPRPAPNRHQAQWLRRQAKRPSARPGNGHDQPRPKRGWILAVAALLASLSGVAAVFNVIPTYQAARTNNDQLQLGEQDRFSAAITELGSPDPSRQLSAISALNSAVQSLPGDQWDIMQDLCSYIRSHDPAPRIADPQAYTGAGSSLSLRVHAALHVIEAAGPSAGPVDLHGADLSGADLRGIDLAGADLNGALLGSANLSNDNLQRAKLIGANLNHANLSGGKLSQAQIDNAYLIEATLNKAIIKAASITNTLMFQARLRNANLSGTHLVIVNAWGSNLQGAILNNAHLLDSTLTGASLLYAKLRAAKLTGCALYDAHLEHADFTGATLVNVFYWHVHTNGTIGFKVISGNALPPPKS